MRRAFTLIELLVVIAIIAILTAILFPVFARAKHAGMGPACITNLKQIALASLTYASDYDDHMAPSETEGRYWGETLQPYMRSHGVLSCRAEGLKTRADQPWSYHYALNDVRDDFDSPIGAASAALGRAHEPARLILFVDGWPLASDPGTGNSRNRHVVNWIFGERDKLRHHVDDGNPRHMDQFMSVMLDSHAKNRQRHLQPDGTFSGGTEDGDWLLDP